MCELQENEALILDGESDYILRDDVPSCWITIGNLSVHPIRTDEGVVVDIYPLGREDLEPIATTFAYFSEAEEAIEMADEEEEWEMEEQDEIFGDEMDEA
jgi:hypothetical protein